MPADEAAKWKVEAIALKAENDKLRRSQQTQQSQTPYPETEVELAKDIYASELKAGAYTAFVNKNLSLGNYTEDDARVLLCYQSLVNNAIEHKLDRDPVNLAGFIESHKMAFAQIATASKDGFLLKNLRTVRSISESELRESAMQQQQQNKGPIKRLMPGSPQGEL